MGEGARGDVKNWVMLLFVPLIADTFLTVVRRTWAGHHPFVPHYDFYYQRMYLAGWSKQRVVCLHWLACTLWGVWGYLLT